MPNDTVPESVHVQSNQELLERISELEEHVINLRRLHQTIERNTGLFEALLAASHDGIALSRLDGTLIRSVKPILGYAAASVVGESIFQFVHPDDRETLREAYRRILDGADRQILHELRMVQKDGSCVTVQDTITDMLDNPAVLAIVHNYRNVTQLRAGEIATAELNAVMRHAPFAMFSKNAAGEVLSWNDGARAMFGYERSEIVGRHVWTLVPDDLREQERRCRSTVIDSQQCAKMFTVRIHKDGAHIPIELVLTPLVTDDRVHGIMDISYRRAFE